MAKEIAIDLGTANSLVYVKGKGIVIREPSVVAIQKDVKNKVLAVGNEAKSMIGRTPGNIIAIRPLRDGYIADFDTTMAMMKYFFNKALGSGFFSSKPLALVCVPAGTTSVEERAVRQSCMQAGAKKVYIMTEPMAAAIGAGLPIEEPTGSMIVDIGGGTTDVAVLSLGGIVTSQSIRVGGDKMDESIVNFIKNKYSLLIGERTAEEVKMAIGTVLPDYNETPNSIVINGRELISGLPRQVEVNDREIYLAFKDNVDSIVAAVKACLEQTPPELTGDIMDRGIMMTGGGALLHGLDILLSEQIGIPVHIADDPLSSVAIGAGMALDNMKLLASLDFNSDRI